jgi:hypothetical protein
VASKTPLAASDDFLRVFIFLLSYIVSGDDCIAKRKADGMSMELKLEIISTHNH